MDDGCGCFVSIAMGVLDWVLGLLVSAAAIGAVYLRGRGGLAGYFSGTRRRGVLLLVISAELTFLACLLGGATLYLRQPSAGALLLSCT